MEIKEGLKQATNKAKEKELDLDKVERARQRIRQNKSIKQDWAAQCQSKLETQQKLNLNGQEDSQMAQGILMKNHRAQDSLKKPGQEVLHQSILLNGTNGIPACYGLTGRQESPTQTGPPTWRELIHDASTVRSREETGVTKEEEEIRTIGFPTLNPPDTEEQKSKTEGILEDLTTTRNPTGHRRAKIEDGWNPGGSNYDPERLERWMESCTS